MNKRLYLIIVLVSMIPGLFAIGRGLFDLNNSTSSITGNAIFDNGSQSSYFYQPTWGTMIFGAIIIVLALALGLTILYFKIKSAMNKKSSKISKTSKIAAKPAKKTSKVHTIRTNLKAKFMAKMHKEDSMMNHKGMSGMGLTDDKAGKYMVMMVAIVAIIGIVIILIK